MCRKLDLSGVRNYTNVKCDIIDAMNLIGEKVYLSDDVNFESYEEGNLIEVSYSNNISYPFLGECGIGAYRYLILEKYAKFVEGNEIKMNKATILKEYEETIQKVSELSMLLANFDSNTEFSRRSYEFLWLLKENFCQNMKILETIAENEKIYEIYDIQRKHFNHLTSTSGE